MSVLEVDTDTVNDPMLWAPHNGLRTVVHQGMGFLPFDPDRVGQFLTVDQKRDTLVSGYELFKELQGLPLLNANYLEAWMLYMSEVKHSEKEDNEEIVKLYPPELRRGRHGFTLYLFFWGTLYENAARRRFVRYLCKTSGQKPYAGMVGLDCPHFRQNCPVAIWS